MEGRQPSLPFRWAVVDDFAPRDFVADLEIPCQSWSGWVNYRNELERKSSCRDFSDDFDPSRGWRTLFNWLQDPKQAASWGRWILGEALDSDPTLHGGGCHVTWPGGYLQSHLDYQLHPHLGKERRLNLILFTVPFWREPWGGALEFYADDGVTVQHRIYPAFNRAVFFEPTSLCYHGTQPTTADAPPRVSAATYYLSEPRPGLTRKRALYVPRR